MVVLGGWCFLMGEVPLFLEVDAGGAGGEGVATPLTRRSRLLLEGGERGRRGGVGGTPRRDVTRMVRYLGAKGIYGCEVTWPS